MKPIALNGKRPPDLVLRDARKKRAPQDEVDTRKKRAPQDEADE
jgi:hypothetical protein